MTNRTAYDGSYDEALQRFHRTGPEFDGWLSNHGPMVVEALARRGDGGRVHSWVDGYAARLDERPRGINPVDAAAWRDPLGDPLRTGDWIDFMCKEVREEPWRDVLARWWPRLLPGIAAGATHGVIRVGHAVQALADEENEVRLDELAHGLAYWAARWQPVPAPVPTGSSDPLSALVCVPAVPEQAYGIRNRLAQLPQTAGYGQAVAGLDASGDPMGVLERVVDAAVARYVVAGHGDFIMLVHSATAPAAVARVLPHLPAELVADSVRAAWAASCAVVAAYRPDADREPTRAATDDADEMWQAAIDARDEHIIKLADTALASGLRTGSRDGVDAVATAIELYTA